MDGGDDPVFEERKDVDPGQCAIYRIIFTNEGTGQLTDVTVQDSTPSFTTYKSVPAPTAAKYETTPPGLNTGVITAPADGGTGAIVWPYTNNPGLAPGDSGSVTYEVQVEQ